jgi:uncharacterized protein YfbU (UPF0304 family)
MAMTNAIPYEIFKRLVLTNQYRILALLNGESGPGFWERAAEAAESGWPARTLPGVDRLNEAELDPLTEADQEFVLDVFTVYLILQDAAAEGMEAGDGLGVEFPGFDGNHESRLLAYALHLQSENRFTSVRTAGDGYNSHWPMADCYRNMIAAWRRLGRPLRLSRPHFDEIVAERARPIDLAAAIGPQDCLYS